MLEVAKRTVDAHGIFGASGLLAALTLSTVNTAIAFVVGAATAVYMTFKAMREYRKWKKDE